MPSKVDGKNRGRASNLTNAGKGRPKGSRNKTTALLKDAILKAAEQRGNKIGSDGLVSYLEQQAEDNPGPFLSLLGKVLPMQLAGTGEEGEHVFRVVLEGVSADSQSPAS